jgi:hypothetical protein
VSFRQTTTVPLAAACVLAAACAQSIPPPGGELDRTPPGIIATVPDTQAIVPDFTDAVKFTFDERISERGAERSVIVSPATGEVHIDRGRSSISVKLDGGWRPNEVYRVILLPGVRDLFGNERKEPAELVFSTGAPIPETAIAGVVVDRITGRPASRVIVDAFRSTDSVTYSTVGDSAAFFALRFVPQGSYELRAWVDQNENRRRDASEAISMPQVLSLNTAVDTVILELSVVPADTTSPVLQRAEVRDSLQVRLFTDDYLDPGAPLEFVEVALHVLPDSTPVAGTHRLIPAVRFDHERAVADSIARANEAARDTTVRPDSAAARPPQSPPVRPSIGAPNAAVNDSTLPKQEIVLIPGTSLQPGTRYAVTVRGLTNISARSGGGGTVTFETPESPGPATPDTSAVRRDTIGGARMRPAPARTSLLSFGRRIREALFAKKE